MAAVAAAGTAFPITSAQGVNGASQVFFVNENNSIAYWVSREEPEKEPKDDPHRYVDGYLKDPKDKSKNIKSQSKDLDAVSYAWENTDFTRIYFADQDGFLKELCLDTKKGEQSPDWKWGSLGDGKIKVKKGSPISAHVNLPTVKGRTPQLKVYYFTEDSNQIKIAWHVVGTQGWKAKSI